MPQQAQNDVGKIGSIAKGAACQRRDEPLSGQDTVHILDMAAAKRTRCKHAGANNECSEKVKLTGKKAAAAADSVGLGVGHCVAAIADCIGLGPGSCVAILADCICTGVGNGIAAIAEGIGL